MAKTDPYCRVSGPGDVSFQTDFLKADPATLQPSAELDAFIAVEWMGWKTTPIGFVFRPECESPVRWSPSTNPAHAGEARRVADEWRLRIDYYGGQMGIRCVIWVDDSYYSVCAFCGYPETNNDKGQAEALAICRAIVAAVQARK